MYEPKWVFHTEACAGDTIYPDRPFHKHTVEFFSVRGNK